MGRCRRGWRGWRPHRSLALAWLAILLPLGSPALAGRPGEVLSREFIAEALGTPEAGERAVDVQVTRLRRKIEPDPREPRFLHTIRHKGYVLRPGP